jgi:hypothetical protein
MGQSTLDREADLTAAFVGIVSTGCLLAIQTAQWMCQDNSWEDEDNNCCCGSSTAMEHVHETGKHTASKAKIVW